VQVRNLPDGPASASTLDTEAAPPHVICRAPQLWDTPVPLPLEVLSHQCWACLKIFNPIGVLNTAPRVSHIRRTPAVTTHLHTEALLGAQESLKCFGHEGKGLSNPEFPQSPTELLRANAHIHSTAPPLSLSHTHTHSHTHTTHAHIHAQEHCLGTHILHVRATVLELLCMNFVNMV
jgi:hypothetical protein